MNETTRFVAAAMTAAAVSACSVELPEASVDPPAEESGRLAAEPASDDGSIAPVCSLAWRVEGGASEEASFAIVEGRVSTVSVERMRAGVPSEALEARLVAHSAFPGPDAWTLRPHVPLERRSIYTVVRLEGDEPEELVIGEPTRPYLARRWPPPEVASRVLVLCGDSMLDPLESSLALVPSGRGATARVGTQEGRARACVWVRVDDDARGDDAQHLPLGLELGEWIDLDPLPWRPDIGPDAAVEPVDCVGSEIAFGPGCAVVGDDRLEVRPPDAPMLWNVEGAGRSWQIASRGGEPFELRGLPPSQTLALQIETTDTLGDERSFEVVITTAPPSAHWSISEVYADAVGPEPAQEWIELYNAGPAEGSTAGLVLEDVGGATPLPPASIPAGGFALVVAIDFDPASPWDVAPHEGTPLLVVERVGKNGLTNSGEPLRLVDANGALLAAFPADPAPKPGVSVALEWLDDPASPFVRSDPPTPGAPPSGSPPSASPSP